MRNHTITAFVPMRHHSQRVPGKNYRPLAGKPLFHHILETLLKVPQIDTVAVDTDSEPVMEGVRRFFPTVRLIERPVHLRADDVPMNDILLHDTAQIESDFYLQTHSTNPLLQAGTIAGGIHSFLSTYPEHDSLFSVTRLQTRLYFQDGRAINHNPRELIQTQDLPPVYEENSCLYLFTRDNLVQWHHRIGPKPLMYEVPAEQAWDIDEELDFTICDFLLKRQFANEKP
jgi:CMP-N-acetylneuraminic acid synthetase